MSKLQQLQARKERLEDELRHVEKQVSLIHLLVREVSDYIMRSRSVCLPIDKMMHACGFCVGSYPVTKTYRPYAQPEADPYSSGRRGVETKTSFAALRSFQA